MSPSLGAVDAETIDRQNEDLREVRQLLEEANARATEYLEELTRCGVAAKGLMEQALERQKEGDRLRLRLAKVIDVMEAADKYIVALKAREVRGNIGGQVMANSLEADALHRELQYNQTKQKLGAPDGDGT